VQGNRIAPAATKPPGEERLGERDRTAEVAKSFIWWTEYSQKERGKAQAAVAHAAPEADGVDITHGGGDVGLDRTTTQDVEDQGQENNHRLGNHQRPRAQLNEKGRREDQARGLGDRESPWGNRGGHRGGNRGGWNGGRGKGHIRDRGGSGGGRAGFRGGRRGHGSGYGGNGGHGTGGAAEQDWQSVRDHVAQADKEDGGGWDSETPDGNRQW